MNIFCHFAKNLEKIKKIYKSGKTERLAPKKPLFFASGTKSRVTPKGITRL